MFQFSCRFALFINLLSLKPDSENIANFNAVSRKHANFDEVQFFEKNIPQFIIFGTHNLQTFQHNAFISELLVMPFYLFNIRPKFHHRKLRKLCHTVPNILNVTSSLLMVLFVQPSSGNSLINCQAL